MAKFKIKDLVVNLSSRATFKLTPTICLFPTKICNWHSIVCRPLTFDCVTNTLLNCRLTEIACRLGTIDLTDITDGGCGPNYSTCWNSDFYMLDIRDLVINQGDISHVKDQLAQLMDGISERAVEVAHDMAPQSVEALDAVEAGLQDALKEVKARRKKLG